ncbi:hypothetical protein K0B04_03700 [Patescibacteria group bacterium]|nr:hypothetical protein [Patescibacteria group bacterium]
MLQILAQNKFNIVLILVLFLLLLLILFPLENLISKILKTKISKVHIFSILVLVALSVIFYVSKLDFILSLPMIVFSFFVFLLGFLSERKYIYLLALISLGLTPIMLILKMEDIAEFFAQTCYLLLVLGVLKDIFYEKIFE